MSLQLAETKRIIPPSSTNVPLDDEKVRLDKHEIIQILKDLEGIKRKLQPLVAKWYLK